MSFQRRVLKKIQWLQPYRQKYKNFDDFFSIVAVSFACGLLIGGMWAFHVLTLPSAADSEAGSFRWSSLAKKFAPVSHISGRQPDGSFVFSDFESSADFRIWRIHAAEMEVSAEHASEGGHSARLHFFGNTRMAAVSIENYFSSRFGHSDWNDYRALRLHLFNPAGEPGRLILQIKDHAGHVFKKDLILPPGKGQDFEVTLEELSAKVDIRDVGQISLFVWEPRGDQTFYLDHLRLLPQEP